MLHQAYEAEKQARQQAAAEAEKQSRAAAEAQARANEAEQQGKALDREVRKITIIIRRYHHPRVIQLAGLRKQVEDLNRAKSDLVEQMRSLTAKSKEVWYCGL